MELIEVYIQGEGLRALQFARVSPSSTVAELIEEAHRVGVPREPGILLFLEDSEAPCPAEQQLDDAGIGHRSRVHCHRCHRIQVTINYNADSAVHPFPPSATVERVKAWADDRFGIKGADTTAHALKLCGTATYPEDDWHLGGLTAYPVCSLCFDLVAKRPVQG